MTKIADLSIAVRHAHGITLERLDPATRMYIEALEADATARTQLRRTGVSQTEG